MEVGVDVNLNINAGHFVVLDGMVISESHGCRLGIGINVGNEVGDGESHLEEQVWTFG